MIECDHVYVNRIISHEVIVSEYITLQTLHRRFLPDTPCVGLILKTYSRHNYLRVKIPGFEVGFALLQPTASDSKMHLCLGRPTVYVLLNTETRVYVLAFINASLIRHAL